MATLHCILQHMRDTIPLWDSLSRMEQISLRRQRTDRSRRILLRIPGTSMCSVFSPRRIALAVRRAACSVLTKANPIHPAVTAKTNRLETPLFVASSLGHEATVRFLLSRDKSALNTVDAEGNTPLQGAAHAKHYGVAQILIDAGADIHLIDEARNTALHYACWVGDVRIVKALLDKGADMRVKNEDDSYPIHYAAQGIIPTLSLTCLVFANLLSEGHLKCVQELVSRGAVLDVSNTTGVTPLLLAIRKKAIDTIEYLIDSVRAPGAAFLFPLFTTQRRGVTLTNTTPMVLRRY